MRFRRALVVDDEPGSRAVLKHILELGGLLVDAVSNGRAGLKRIREDHPDLVVTDIRMPGITGVEMATRVHEDEGDHPVMVAVTRHPEDVEGKEVFDLVLRKPVSPARFLAWLADRRETPFEEGG
ncbi:MAG TPA: response regulator [Longimicrobiales bacterium]|nr:response regulator [Longimicrobiales bacterium]